MAIRTLPSQTYLRQCFDYDPLTGIVTWRERPTAHFGSEAYRQRFNSRFAGKRAGSRRKDTGHWEVALGRNYLLHRVIWKLVHGTEPDEIDHENIDGGDNRLRNLRDCAHHQNMSNTKIRKDNTTGYRGVYLLDTGRWRAAIRHKGKAMHIGHFRTKEEAAAAYAVKSAELHGAFAGQLGV
jgi:hypothetical protein